MYSDLVKTKLFSYFTQRAGMFEYRRGWLKGDCPYCGKENKFGINIDENRGHCFSCDIRVSPLKFVFDKENFTTFSQVHQFLGTFENIKSFRTEAEIVKGVVNFQLPKEFRLVGLYDSQVAKIVEQNLKERNFKIPKLMRAGVGYCAGGKYGGRIILPYYRGGKLVYFNARKFVDIGEKFMNPTEEEAGVGKSKLIYNHDALYSFDKVYLFESVTNALTLGDNATGTGCKSLSPWQRNEYIQSPCKSIIIGLDRDALKEAYKLALEFANFKKVKVLKFPEGVDANDLGYKETKKLEKATPYITYKEAYKLFINA